MLHQAEYQVGDHIAEGRVDFDFGGALNLARQLWALATKLDETRSTRMSAAQTALQEWQGAFADQFVTRTNRSDQAAHDAVYALQSLAKDFAMAWAHAATQQRWNDRAAWIAQKENNKNAWDTVTGWVFGDHTDEGTPHPLEVEVPSPSGFDPTANPYVQWEPQ